MASQTEGSDAASRNIAVLVAPLKSFAPVQEFGPGSAAITAVLGPTRQLPGAAQFTVR